MIYQKFRDIYQEPTEEHYYFTNHGKVLHYLPPQNGGIQKHYEREMTEDVWNFVHEKNKAKFGLKGNKRFYQFCLDQGEVCALNRWVCRFDDTFNIKSHYPPMRNFKYIKNRD